MNTTIDTSNEQHPVKVERFTRNLRCALNESEVNQRARRAAALGHLIGQAEGERDAAKKRANAEIELLQSERNILDQEVNDSATYRDVECQRVFNYRMGEKYEIRTDTKEEIPGSKQPLTDRERQLELGSKAAGSGGGEAAEDDDAVVDNDYAPAGDEPDLETTKKPKGKGGRKGGGK